MNNNDNSDIINEKKWRNKKTLAKVFLLLTNIIFFATVWLMNMYDDIKIDQFIYQLKSSTTGVNSSLPLDAFLFIGLSSFGLTALTIWLYPILYGKINKHKILENKDCFSRKIFSFLNRNSLSIGLSLLFASVFFFLYSLNVFAYIGKTMDNSDFIEENYINPQLVNLTFPEEKRNLIYIFLESMENTFADANASQSLTHNYIPELAKFAKENINFSNTTGFGGIMPYTGTTWTAAGMVSQTSGVTIKIPLLSKNYGGEDVYMPGIISLGDILEEEGYNQSLLLGSVAEFASRDSYFTEHGNYEIIDINYLKASGRLPKDYWEWWGYEDEKLFTFAKEEILRLAKLNEPFNFNMLTADTHFPDGYKCKLCQDTYEEQYANVLACSSKQVYDFVKWIQQQQFYENTTIVICGDHLTMDSNFLKDLDEDYVRTVYNCIINSVVEPIREKNRFFGSFDMFPTTLAAMGINIEGNRLGLGTNLFSEKQTLTEIYGFEILDEELQKQSEYYNNTLLEMGKGAK